MKIKFFILNPFKFTPDRFQIFMQIYLFLFDVLNWQPVKQLKNSAPIKLRFPSLVDIMCSP